MSSTTTAGRLRSPIESVQRANGTLFQSEDYYRTLFEHMDQGFCVIEVLFDADGIPVDYRFLETNLAFERQTGLHDVVGKSIRQLAPGHEQHWFDIYGQVACTGQPVRFVNEAKALHGRWFDVSAFRLGSEDSRTVAVLFNDITDRKRLERTQQDFVAMASHDLATPVTVLRARAQLMQRRKAYDQEAIDAIIEQTSRMERLIADLRDLARAAAERIRVQATTHTVRLEIPETPARGNWDPNRLGRVLDNLMGNAVRYSRSDGEITIRVEVAGAEALVNVADEGDGISADVLPRLFERYYRADRGDDATGLGIGLYISRMLVEAHGGRIWAKSAPGQGSAFTVALPI